MHLKRIWNTSHRCGTQYRKFIFWPGKTLKEHKKAKERLFLNSNQNTYNRGDMVFKLDTTRKVGVCPKLKSPWKGSYVIVEIKPPTKNR